MSKIIQKVYCYVDETGQDAGSDFFVVVAVVAVEPVLLRQMVADFEQTAGVG